MALVAEKEEEEEKALKSLFTGKASSSNACEGKNEIGKNRGKIIEENEEFSTQDELDDLDEHLAFLARKFSKLKFKEMLSALDLSTEEINPNHLVWLIDQNSNASPVV